MIDSNKTFNDTDGCILTALIISGRSSTLKDIVFVSNTINHDIISFEGLNQGLSRLESEGFIRYKNGRIFISKKTKDFDKKNKKRFESCIDMKQRYSNIIKNLMLNNEIQYKQYFSIDEYIKVVNILTK